MCLDWFCIFFFCFCLLVCGLLFVVVVVFVVVVFVGDLDNQCVDVGFGDLIEVWMLCNDLWLRVFGGEM